MPFPWGFWCVKMYVRLVELDVEEFEEFGELEELVVGKGPVTYVRLK